MDFKLANDSPGIDAGLDEFYLADTDRSRNDIGAYGGPWNIGQFDVQRESTNNAPYIFPLIDFSDGGNFANDQLKVRAIGIAKQR